MNKRALAVGLGIMGRAHSSKVTSDDLKMITLEAACDCDIDKIIAYQKLYPDVPTYLVPKHTDLTPEDKKRAAVFGIECVDTVADLVREFEIDTLINATHSDSHIDVLKDALSVKDEKNKPQVQTIFQEKPFAMTMAEARDIAALIRRENIQMNLNGTLTFSQIWSNFFENQNQLTSEGFQLSEVHCAYGKNRMQDTRPAIGGWVGLEGIHALDISTVGLEGLQISPDKITATEGFLAKNANPETGDGTARYAIEAEMTAIETRTKRPIKISLEGSFAYEEQTRRVQYCFENADGHKAILQLDFDVRADGSRFDYLHVKKMDAAGKTVFEDHFKTNADKLMGYYKSSLDPKSHLALYDLSRALDVQVALDNLAKASDVKYLSAHDIFARRVPEMGSIVKAEENGTSDNPFKRAVVFPQK